MIARERPEDEAQQCGAAYGFLIDRAGRVIAADGLIDGHDLTGLALRLVPTILASRSLTHPFREWPLILQYNKIDLPSARVPGNLVPDWDYERRG